MCVLCICIRVLRVDVIFSFFLVNIKTEHNRGKKYWEHLLHLLLSATITSVTLYRRKLYGSEPPVSETTPPIDSSSVLRLVKWLPTWCDSLLCYSCFCVLRPIQDSNIGHQLLSRMGWKDGQGLGRYEQGQIEPVSGIRRWLICLCVWY